MPKIARLFANGGSQAVRLPAEYRFDCSEVMIEKVGDVVLLKPVRKDWDEFFDAPEVAPADFLSDRGDTAPQDRKLF